MKTDPSQTYEQSYKQAMELLEKVSYTNEKLSMQLQHQDVIVADLVAKVGTTNNNLNAMKNSFDTLCTFLSKKLDVLPNPAKEKEPEVTFTLPMSKAVEMLHAPAYQEASAHSMDYKIPALFDPQPHPTSLIQSGLPLKYSQDWQADETKLGINKCDTSVLSLAEKKLCIEEQKINAIKELRHRTGLGLKEAKEAIEAWMVKVGKAKYNIAGDASAGTQWV